MANLEKKKGAMVVHKRIRKRPSSFFAKLGCDTVTYEFDVGVDAFDLARFYEETGLSAAHRNWSTVFNARDERSDYHVHFNGRIRRRRIELTVAYYPRSAPPTKKGPFAETVMEWLGSFFRKPIARATVTSMFSKQTRTWRSRFNLPFKVTMTGSNAEVVITGISLELPANRFGAVHGWLTKFPNELLAMVMMVERPVAFTTFRIEEELPAHNEALKIFMEEVK